MPSQFFGLNIAGSGLSAYQSAINTTANNISNVQTTGYSKQVNNREAAQALRVNSRYGSVGAGVVTTSVTQLRNRYYDEKYWENESNRGYYENQNYYMSQIETYFTDDTTTTGFSTLLSEMFNQLDSLGSSAADETVRKSFISSCQKVSTYFTNIGNELSALQSSVNDEIKTTVDNINSISQKVALLNKQINAIEVNGGYANELRDERALLIDELSAIMPVEITEVDVENSNYPDMQTGATNYTVKVNGQTLVDGNDYRTLTATARVNKVNQTDIDGLYDLTWSDTGMEFLATSSSMSGSLKSMFEMRDGNNGANFTGTVSEYDLDADTVTYSGSDFSITSVENLNMPAAGMITIGNRVYTYDGFSYTTKMDDDGNEVIQSVTFCLTSDIGTEDENLLQNATSSVGRSIQSMGIPYYMNQMSSFLRSFCQKFNNIEESGVDLNGDAMGAFFVANTEAGEEDFSDYASYRDAFDTEVENYKAANTSATNTEAKAAAAASVGEKTYRVGVRDTTTGKTIYDSSYYLLTASNFSVAKESTTSPTKFATTSSVANGVEASELVDSLQKLYDDTTIYRGCEAKDFLQCILDDISVDTEQAETFENNYTSIQTAIDTQRKSISGVDEDEEALDLLKFQNAYNMSAKVVSVLTEMYDQLILETGV
jgi:flagellar hook-associated protein 1